MKLKEDSRESFFDDDFDHLAYVDSVFEESERSRCKDSKNERYIFQKYDIIEILWHELYVCICNKIIASKNKKKINKKINKKQKVDEEEKRNLGTR